MATKRKGWDIAKNYEKYYDERRPWLDIFQAEHYFYGEFRLEILAATIRKLCRTVKIKSSKPSEKYLIIPE